jgi:hypothetical protein
MKEEELRRNRYIAVALVGVASLSITHAGSRVRPLSTAGIHVDPATPAKVAPLGIPGSWIVDWTDEFNRATLDGTKWTVASHAPSGALNCYAPGQVSLARGSIHMLLEHRTASCGDGGRVTRDYVSGSVKARETFSGGAFEARINVPMTASGSQVANWPAWWMTGWPISGEIDIWEGLAGAGACWSVHPEPVDPGGCVVPTPGWHTYGASWVNGVGVEIYYDGVKIASAPFVVTSPDYPVLDNATATWAAVATPADMRVDYVRHWVRA